MQNQVQQYEFLQRLQKPVENDEKIKVMRKHIDEFKISYLDKSNNKNPRYHSKHSKDVIESYTNKATNLTDDALSFLYSDNPAAIKYYKTRNDNEDIVRNANFTDDELLLLYENRDTMQKLAMELSSSFLYVYKDILGNAEKQVANDLISELQSDLGETLYNKAEFLYKYDFNRTKLGKYPDDQQHIRRYCFTIVFHMNLNNDISKSSQDIVLNAIKEQEPAAANSILVEQQAAANSIQQELNIPNELNNNNQITTKRDIFIEKFNELELDDKAGAAFDAMAKLRTQKGVSNLTIDDLKVSNCEAFWAFISYMPRAICNYYLTEKTLSTRELKNNANSFVEKLKEKASANQSHVIQ